MTLSKAVTNGVIANDGEWITIQRVLIARVLKDGTFNIPALKRVAKRCLSVTRGKRPEPKNVFKEMAL